MQRSASIRCPRIARSKSLILTERARKYPTALPHTCSPSPSSKEGLGVRFNNPSHEPNLRRAVLLKGTTRVEFSSETEAGRVAEMRALRRSIAGNFRLCSYRTRYWTLGVSPKSTAEVGAGAENCSPPAKCSLLLGGIRRTARGLAMVMTLHPLFPLALHRIPFLLLVSVQE